MHIDLLKAQDPRNYIGSAWTHSTWFSLSLSLSLWLYDDWTANKNRVVWKRKKRGKRRVHCSTYINLKQKKELLSEKTGGYGRRRQLRRRSGDDGTGGSLLSLKEQKKNWPREKGSGRVEMGLQRLCRYWRKKKSERKGPPIENRSELTCCWRFFSFGWKRKKEKSIQT